MTAALFRVLALSALCAAGSVFVPAPAAAQTKLLRFPDIHGDRVVFTLRRRPLDRPGGGRHGARRLTAHPGLELFAKFSPDGKWIAFTGQYDGDEQVYVMPATGGVPKQLTFYPARGPLRAALGLRQPGLRLDARRQVACSSARMRDGWDLPTAASTRCRCDRRPRPSRCRCRSRAPATSRPTASRSSTRRSPATSAPGSATRAAGPGPLRSSTSRPTTRRTITDDPRTERDPMWIGDKIYFNSDRNGTLNLYSYDVGERRRPRSSRTARRGTCAGRAPTRERPDRLRAERRAARLRHEDGHSDRRSRIDGARRRLWHAAVAVSAARPDRGRRRCRPRASARCSWRAATSSPRRSRRGRRATSRARSGAHDKWAALVAGRPQDRVHLRHDRRGGDLRRSRRTASASPRQLTKGGKAMRYAPEWSPDGKRIAFGDKDGSVYVARRRRQEARRRSPTTPRGQIRDYTWSPGGNHLAFSMTDAERPAARSTSGARRTASCAGSPTTLFNADSPAWDPDGNYLYYLSDREFAPQLVDGRVQLRARTAPPASSRWRCARTSTHPFPPESDEVTLDKDDEAGRRSRRGRGGKTDAASRTKADDRRHGQRRPAAIRHRLRRPGARGSPACRCRPTTTTASRRPRAACSTSRRPRRLLRPRQRSQTGRCRSSRFKDRKETTLADDVRRLRALAPTARRCWSRQRRRRVRRSTTPTPRAARIEEAGRRPPGLMVDRVPAEEWAEIFDEVWRRYRDFFYVENMHGYDWEALRKQYEPLVAARRPPLGPELRDRRDDRRAQRRSTPTSPAATIGLPPRAARRRCPAPASSSTRRRGRYRIARIFAGQNEEEIYRSPLTEIGVDAKVGDYVLAIDGEELAARRRPLPPAAPQGRPAGHADAQRRRRRWTARAASPSSRSRPRATCSISTGCRPTASASTS